MELYIWLMVWLGFIIIIIIMSRYQHGYFWPSLATPPYRPLLPASSLGYISYRHSANVCRFKLVVLPLFVHVKYITYELVPTAPAVSCMSGSFNFYSVRDRWKVAAQMLLCGVLSPGLVQYCSQHSCVIAIKLFLHVVHSYSSIETTTTWKKWRFKSDFHEIENLSVAVHAFASPVLMSVLVDETLLPR